MNNLYRVITIFVSIISVVFIIFSEKEIPNNIVFLPLCYLLFFILIPSFSKYILKNIGITVLNFSMLIRYSISPLLMSIYGVNLNTGVFLTESIQSKAINLMIYEMVLMFITFLLFQKKFYKSSTLKKLETIKASNPSFSWIFVVVTSIIILIFPEILNRYSFIWTTSQLKSKEVEGISYSFLLILVQLGHLVFTINIINLLYKYYTKNKSFLYVILSIIIVGFSSSFMVGTSRFSIILPLVTGLFTIFLIFKPYRKIIGIISFSMSLILIILTSILKANTISGKSKGNSINESLNNLNDNLQLYFSGVSNVAHSINTRVIYESFNYENILPDLVRSVVFIGNLFTNYHSAIVDYNMSFYGRSGIYDQILPMVGQGFLYFGYIFAPIFSVLTIIIIMYLDKKIAENNSLFTVYILVYLCLKFALFNMGNATIQISFFTNFFVVLMIINLFNKYIRVVRGGK
ncbi:hypothetical protein L1F34_002338 [Mammaliicoccus lentus]|uniref:O-antigen polymerase n=1 Tax=Mammaliicoccus lentus TaxID=42858 RepID=UPI0039EA4AFD